MRKILLLLLVLSYTTIFAQPTDTVRVAAYNVLNYPGAQGTERTPYLHTVVQSLDPDILVVEEMQGSDGMSQFNSGVMNAEQIDYNYAPFYNLGSDYEIGLFYRRNKFRYLGQKIIPTELRDIVGYELQMAYPADTSFTFWIFGAHLKASSGTDNQNRREEEVTALKDSISDFPEGTHYMVVGDFNLYTYLEPAYQTFLNEFTIPLYDPLDAPVNWHNSGSYSWLHTQSTRTGQLSDGGSSGGMDDRFDFILLSTSFQDSTGLRYITNSYKAYGNDGNHFNASINSGTNGVVSSSVANALYYSSDHLPVTANMAVQLLVSPGDINADGALTTADLQRLMEIILGNGTQPTSAERALADVNADHTIDIRDALALLNAME